jgi:hypothetical protein
LETVGHPSHQSGKLKTEGWFTGVLIRSPKNYFLFGKLSPEARRALGVPRRTQQQLSMQHFGQDSELNTPVVKTSSMRPTTSMNIVLLEESKSISHPLMLKRIHIVS